MYDIKDPKHFTEIMQRVKNTFQNEALNTMDGDAIPLFDGKSGFQQAVLVVQIYNSGVANQVPGCWSHIFMEEAEKYREEQLRSEDPDWIEYQRLQKKFGKSALL